MAKRLLAHTNDSNKAVIRSVFRQHHHTDDIVNKDGMIKVLGDLGVAQNVVAKHNVISALMQIMDTNNNGEVDFEEFYKYWCSIAADKNKTSETLDGIGELFNCYSTYETGSGALSQEQFKKLWSDMGNDNNLVDEAIRFVDKNNDNQISFQELCIAFGLLSFDVQVDMPSQ